MSDGKGHLYVALEDKDAVGVVDRQDHDRHGALSLGDKQGGHAGQALALDARNRVLFVACRNPAVVVAMNADTGAVLATIPIGLQNDGVLFNPATNEALAPTGDGHLTIIKEDGAGTVLGWNRTLTTLPGAQDHRTGRRKTGHIFLMTPPGLLARCRRMRRAAAQPGRIARGPMLPDSFKIHRDRALRRSGYQ